MHHDVLIKSTICHTFLTSKFGLTGNNPPKYKVNRHNTTKNTMTAALRHWCLLSDISFRGYIIISTYKDNAKVSHVHINKSDAKRNITLIATLFMFS